MKRKILFAIALIAVAVGVFSAIQLYKEISEYRKGSEVYDNMTAYIKEPAEDTISEKTGETDESEEIDWPVVDFSSLRKINPDCVAWIQIKDTDINYPVLQGDDNAYYLRHLINGQWNSSGSIFLDYRVGADMTDRHSIIYGHHMKNGTMFSELTKYKEQSYYEEHPIGYLLTPQKNYIIEFFAGYVSKVDDNAWNTEYVSESDFREWLNDVSERSLFESQVTPETTDKILTLSTCSYEFNNARYVLHGIIK